MLAALWLALLGALSLTSAAPASLRAAPLALAALALLPAALVIQDAASLIAQGRAPWSTDWYAAVFGRNLLTMHYGGLPGFYYGLGAVTALACAATISTGGCSPP